MFIVILIVFGLAFGSFINALVWRVHEQSRPKKKRVASDSELSIYRGRSMCPHCQHTLAWYDLLPVVSWALLRGKCRYCHKPISAQYPIVELTTAGLFTSSYVFWPFALVGAVSYLLFGLWLVCLVMLVALAVYDLRWMLLPNRIVFPLTAVSVVYAGLSAVVADDPKQSILLSVVSLLIAGGIFYVLFQISAGKWIGGGDVKIGFALGLLLGLPQFAFLMLFLASIIGIVFSLPTIIFKKVGLKGQIPFGPALIVATVVVKLFGASIITWYTGMFLL